MVKVIFVDQNIGDSLMFTVVDRNGDNFSIKDTNDGVVETYNSNQIAKILKMGIDIQGLSIKNNRLVFNNTLSPKDIAKLKLLSDIDTIILTKDDTVESANKKLRNVKVRSKIIVINNSNITNMTGLFKRCPASEIDLSHFDTSNVTNMNEMFAICNLAKSIDISNFDTSNVISMSRMFEGCKSLLELNLSSFNTSNVIDMSLMFDACEFLVKLDLSNFNTSNVRTMEGMFSDCSFLRALNISSFNTSNVENMGWMFARCAMLRDLDLRHFNDNKVVYTERMFERCNAMVMLSKNSKLMKEL